MPLSSTDMKVGILLIYRGIISNNKIGNPYVILAILRSKKRFQALREFTLETGEAELERLKLEKKEADELESLSRTNSIDTGRNAAAAARAPALRDVPEEDSAFTIGDDEDSDNEERVTTPTQTASSQHSVRSAHSSRAPSISSIEDAVPLQLRGMSEKARGKMPAGQPSFSRQNSTTSLHSLTPSVIGTNGFNFTPTADWVS